MKIHDEIDDWMAGALCDALSPDEQQHFEQHLAECPHCRSLYEETRKMNDMLSQSIPELRPDPNFERRVIAGFREKIAGGGLHPWRGLVWFVQFRTVQAALALLALVAMIKGGSLITGQRPPSTPALAAIVDMMKLPPASPPTIIESQDGYADRSSGQGAGIFGGKNEPFTIDSIPAVPTQAFNGLSDVADANFWKPFGDETDKKVAVTNGTTIITNSGLRAYQVSPSHPATTALTANTKTDYYSRGIPDEQNQARARLRVSGNATFGGLNTYAGATVISSGTLQLGNSSTIAANGYGGIVSGSASNYTGNSITNVTFADTPVTLERAKNFQARRDESEKMAGNKDGVVRRELADNSYNQTRGEALKPDGQKSEDTSTAPNPAPVDNSKLIRNANLDFEVPGYEKALDTITAVAGEEQGYVATQNSESGPNGKLHGEIVVKVLPAHLDRFLLKLRALGDIKNQTVSTEDVTKAYFDTQSHIRNSQIMEARLIDMLKNKTGKVSDLLDVEKEIGRVRGQIEEMQGQIKVYDSQVAYATITISLHEKDVNSTAAYLLQEHAQLSLFAKDVDKAFVDAKGAADAAKAQTLDSHIEREADGRTSATLHLLLPPDASDAAIDKLKALGRIQNFTSQTQRIARDGSTNSDTAKVEHDKVELNLTIQRDEENAVQGTNISVQTTQVEEKTATIKQDAATAGIEVKGAEFNRAQNGVEVSSLLFRMPVKKYAAFLEQIKSLGDVKDFTVTRSEDATATGDAPAEVALQIFSQPNIVTEDNGLWATIRHTLGEGFSALMWSARMIGVSLAFITPWAIALGLVAWFIVRRRKAGKSGK